MLSRIDWYQTLPQAGPSRLAHAAGDLSARAVPLLLCGVIERIRRYLSDGESIGELPWHLIDTRGWSDFQSAVYRCITQIPHGDTRTYAWVARRVGKLSASRAVGQALRKNPLPILIPCHRVVSKTTLGGFM